MSRYLSATDATYGYGSSSYRERSGSESGSRSRSGSRSGSQYQLEPRIEYRTGSTSRSRSRSRSVTPQPNAPLRMDILPGLRVLMQCREDPFDTSQVPEKSWTFRLAAFCMHFALSLLETPEARASLKQTGISICTAWGRRGSRGLAFKGDVGTNPASMVEAVDDFLAKLRSSPPNIIVSTRVTGEGLTQRLPWLALVGENYDPKYAAVFRLNKTIFDNALAAADQDDVAEFQKFLFLLGLSTAHEMVHMFVGYLVGNEERGTPPMVQWPVPTRPAASGAEAGAFWEGQLMGHLTQAYHNPDNRLGNSQAGDLLVMIPGRSEALKVDPSWMRDCLRLDFRFPMQLSGAPVRIKASTKTMQRIRGPLRVVHLSPEDLIPYNDAINTLPTHRVGSKDLRDIMKMATRPECIRARA